MLFSLVHPRWEFVSQPRYAAYLNLIEPWWKTLKSLVLADTWKQIVKAVEEAAEYWNARKNPCVWGKRKRHQPCIPLGRTAMPTISTSVGS